MLGEGRRSRERRSASWGKMSSLSASTSTTFRSAAAGGGKGEGVGNISSWAKLRCAERGGKWGGRWGLDWDWRAAQRGTAVPCQGQAPQAAGRTPARPHAHNAHYAEAHVLELPPQQEACPRAPNLQTPGSPWLLQAVMRFQRASSEGLITACSTPSCLPASCVARRSTAHAACRSEAGGARAACAPTTHPTPAPPALLLHTPQRTPSTHVAQATRLTQAE